MWFKRWKVEELLELAGDGDWDKVEASVQALSEDDIISLIEKSFRMIDKDCSRFWGLAGAVEMATGRLDLRIKVMSVLIARLAAIEKGQEDGWTERVWEIYREISPALNDDFRGLYATSEE